MRVRIHRGSHEIGGTCIEIESKGKRIVLDVGLPLDKEFDDVPLPEIKGFQQPDESLLGVFISHPHADHYGLAAKLPHNTHFLIGAAAERILEVSAHFTPSGMKFDNTTHLHDREAIDLGPFRLTPYLVDHSAYDSYALLVEADGQRLFYSGDFRGHGRKAKQLNRLIDDPPQNVAVLLMEGTTLGRSQDRDAFPTEADLEDSFVKYFNEAKGLALVWCSGQNIDRIASIFRACLKANRSFIVDLYTAHILRATGNPKIPQADWDRIRVFLPLNQKKRIKRDRLYAIAKLYKDNRIFPENLAEAASQSVMLFRPSMMDDLEEAKCLQGARLFYSLWPGYLKDPRYETFFEWLKHHDIEMHHCHTSGHAHLADLRKLAKALSPDMLVPIHTFQPDAFAEQFDNVTVRQDGEWWTVG